MSTRTRFEKEAKGNSEMGIELRVVQLSSEIRLVISNQTCAVPLFDFKITSDQISRHEV